MLYLIGLGLWDERDITLRGLEYAKKCDKVYLEVYTSLLMGMKKENLERLIGKKIHELNRSDVEEHPKFLDEAKQKDVALLVGGDALVATTHFDLILRAKEKRIKTKIIHNASIYSAIAETGLQIYKFGRTVTIPFWEENFKPTSFYDEIKENKKRGLHTLVLLDIKKNKYMNPNQAIETLTKIDKNFEDEYIIIASRIGSNKQEFIYGKAKNLLKRGFGKPLHVLVIPGKMNPIEKEFLWSLS